MTDTDKLKRLADEIAAYPDWMKDDILALIAENEQLRAGLDKIASMARQGAHAEDEYEAGLFDGRDNAAEVARQTLARIDGNHQPASDANPS